VSTVCCSKRLFCIVVLRWVFALQCVTKLAALMATRASDPAVGLPHRKIMTRMESQDCILIVDDEPEIRRLLVDYLARNGFEAVAARDGREMWQMLERHAVDLLVLDLMLPDSDGLTLCRDLRAKSNLPVIMLTARGEETDRIVGIEMGADDYLVKPFNPRELLARIKSILRRTRALPPNLKPEPVRCLAFAGWCLDTAERLLTAPDGVATPLSGGEFRLLRILLEHPNRVVTRDQLIEMIHGREAEAYDRAIDVQVSRLRQRLRDDPREPALIKTVRGEGYVLASTVHSVPSCGSGAALMT
jgi:two-component system OmpR family response regulator